MGKICTRECMKGYFVKEKNCFKCCPGCEICNENKCLDCEHWLKLENGVCMPYCSESYYFNKYMNECLSKITINKNALIIVNIAWIKINVKNVQNLSI